MSVILYSKYGITAHIIDFMKHGKMHYRFIELNREYQAERMALRAAHAYYKREIKKITIPPKKIVRRRRAIPTITKPSPIPYILSQVIDGKKCHTCINTGKEFKTMDEAVLDAFGYLKRMTIL